MWDKVFKRGPRKIFGRQPLKNLKGYGLFKHTVSLQIFQRLSSTNFTWSTLAYFVPYVAMFRLELLITTWVCQISDRNMGLFSSGPLINASIEPNVSKILV